MKPSAGWLRRLERLESRVVRRATHDELRAVVQAMRATVPRAPGLALSSVPEGLPTRWSLLDYHAEQSRGFWSPARFRAFEAGRRSGKTEGRKREIVIRALDPDWPLDTRYIVVGAPTQQQAQRLYWRDLQRLLPRRFVADVRKVEHEIETVTGAVIRVYGMDASERWEGDPNDDLFLDEYADMKSEVYREHLRGSLSTRGRPPGTATFYGTPDMSRGAHFIELCDAAQTDEMRKLGWEYFQWSSKGIIADDEWEAARRETPGPIFAVEYEGKRAALGDRIYYEWDRWTQGVQGLRAHPTRPLVIGLDFNWNPATAVIAQEQCVEDYNDDPIELPDDELDGDFTAVLREVFIRRGNTPLAMRRVLDLIEELGHRGPVHVYGDASGGAMRSSAVEGSDIELVRKVLGPALGERLSLRFRSENPRVRARVNAMNLRLRATDGWVRMLVDRVRCPELAKDFDQVVAKDGAPGEIDKERDDDRTHLSDGLGYYVVDRLPARTRVSASATVRY